MSTVEKASGGASSAAAAALKNVKGSSHPAPLPRARSLNRNKVKLLPPLQRCCPWGRVSRRRLRAEYFRSATATYDTGRTGAGECLITFTIPEYFHGPEDGRKI